ncbi:MAG: acetyl-CoA carboxylase biotin carboxylase subunit, partial [Anaerotignum sp.]|nr:acetyl-CoA carboxylase biotin carboxylase subunit [Anaerotignum sp.]
SIADADSLPVREADEAVCIGPAQASASYLLIDRILSVAASMTWVQNLPPCLQHLSCSASSMTENCGNALW